MEEEYICEYCGDPSDSVDHVIPQSLLKTIHGSGDQMLMRLYMTKTVNCCRDCNSVLGNKAYWTIAQRRNYIKGKLVSRFKHILKSPTWTLEEMAELGYGLRDFVATKKCQKDRILERLAYKLPKDSKYNKLIKSLSV